MRGKKDSKESGGRDERATRTMLKGGGGKIKTRRPLPRARNLISVSNPNDFHKRKIKAQLAVGEYYNILKHVNLLTNYTVHAKSRRKNFSDLINETTIIASKH